MILSQSGGQQISSLVEVVADLEKQLASGRGGPEFISKLYRSEGIDGGKGSLIANINRIAILQLELGRLAGERERHQAASVTPSPALIHGIETMSPEARARAIDSYVAARTGSKPPERAPAAAAAVSTARTRRELAGVCGSGWATDVADLAPPGRGAAKEVLIRHFEALIAAGLSLKAGEFYRDNYDKMQ